MSHPHRKYLERVAKDADRERLRRARAGLKHARTHKQSATRRARELHKASRATFARWKRETSAQLRQEIRALRAEAAITAARAALAEVQGARKRERIWAGSSRSTAAERKHETDDAVRANLGPDELTVFESIKDKLRPGPRMSRTEAFHHWVHEHSAEVARILEKQAHADVLKLEREEREARKQMSRSMRRRSHDELRASAAAMLEAVPF